MERGVEKGIILPYVRGFGMVKKPTSGIKGHYRGTCTLIFNYSNI